MPNGFHRKFCKPTRPGFVGLVIAAICAAVNAVEPSGLRRSLSRFATAGFVPGTKYAFVPLMFCCTRGAPLTLGASGHASGLFTNVPASAMFGMS